jgi:hypothetical protein
VPNVLEGKQSMIGVVSHAAPHMGGMMELPRVGDIVRFRQSPLEYIGESRGPMIALPSLGRVVDIVDGETALVQVPGDFRLHSVSFYDLEVVERKANNP